MKQRLQGIIIGFTAAVILSGAAVWAAVGTESIAVEYSNIKLYIDGVLITPKDANGDIVEPFIYNGTTFLPVRAVGAAFDKSVSWDGDTSSVYVGAAPVATATAAAEDLFLYNTPHSDLSVEGGFLASGTDESNAVRLGVGAGRPLGDNNKFSHENQIVYSINGAAAKFQAKLKPPTESASIELTYRVYGDNKMLYQSPALLPNDEPIQLNLDIACTQLKISVDLVTFRETCTDVATLQNAVVKY